jgi:hypothetical protein
MSKPRVPEMPDRGRVDPSMCRRRLTEALEQARAVTDQSQNTGAPHL